MDIEEAKVVLKREMVNTYAEGKAKAIETVLSELDKKDKIIDSMAEDKYHSISIIEMAEYGREIGSNLEIFINGIPDERAKEIIIEYFTKKVEE